MLALFKAYRKKDPALKSYFELILYPGIWAIFYHRIGHFFYQIHFYFIARLISQLSRFITGIEIHPGAKIGKRFVIDHGMGVVIGETAIVKDDCLIYHGVTLGGTGKANGKRHPTLENNVTVGAKAAILGNITIGENSIVGAGSIVLKDVSANTTVAGVPAKVISAAKN